MFRSSRRFVCSLLGLCECLHGEQIELKGLSDGGTRIVVIAIGFLQNSGWNSSLFLSRTVNYWNYLWNWWARNLLKLPVLRRYSGVSKIGVGNSFKAGLQLDILKEFKLEVLISVILDSNVSRFSFSSSFSVLICYFSFTLPLGAVPGMWFPPGVKARYSEQMASVLTSVCVCLAFCTEHSASLQSKSGFLGWV